ncbi:MAG: hypothetical protein JST36_06880 [Bacteroidetes bacterium]|nr:hypothetical protein [Bacteroidota bacterium]
MALSFRKIWTGMPVLFPLLALFHVLMLAVAAVGFARSGDLFSFIPGGTVLEWLLYSLFWIGVSITQRRLPAILYILLAAGNLCLQFLTPETSDWRSIGSTVFPFDILLCFFLLYYYKRLKRSNKPDDAAQKSETPLP